MFDKSAEFYDLMYSQLKDYDHEVQHIHKIIEQHDPGHRTVLDVGCGSGEHAHRLAQDFGYEVDGIDAESEDVKVCRMSHTEIEGTISRLHFEYLIGRQGGISKMSETHEMGLFTQSEMMEGFQSVGLNVEYEYPGFSDRGLYIAEKAV